MQVKWSISSSSVYSISFPPASTECGCIHGAFFGTLDSEERNGFAVPGAEVTIDCDIRRVTTFAGGAAAGFEIEFFRFISIFSSNIDEPAWDPSSFPAMPGAPCVKDGETAGNTVGWLNLPSEHFDLLLTISIACSSTKILLHLTRLCCSISAE